MNADETRDFGSTFEFEGKTFLVIHKVSCQECCFWKDRKCTKPRIAGPCSYAFTSDGKNRIFREEKQLKIDL